MPRLSRREIIAGTVALLASGVTGCGARQSRLKFGWQTPLATQGQLASILRRTDILGHNHLEADFLAFSFGTPQMEAARAGALDVAFVGDQPLINLMCAGAPWKILCRLFDTRVCMYRNAARPWSGPRGATFAAPRGSVAHREMYYYQTAAGLNPASDVTNVFIDAAEIGALAVRRDWGDVDVIAIWEPLASRFEATPGVVKFFERTTLGVVGVGPGVWQNAQTVAALRSTILDAWRYFLAHEAQAHSWYNELSASNVPAATLARIARIDRNFRSNAPSIDLTAQDRAELARSIDWAVRSNGALNRVAVPQILV
jgi:ABC-type nitrate/sulfonate/bicarbonate transport system substrate-binding protein